MRSLLFGVEPVDPVSIGAAVAMLGVIATASSLLPVWRAMNIDPSVMLREE